MENENAILMAHCGSDVVTLEELNRIEPNAPMGRRHYPVAHRDLVLATRNELAKIGLEPTREKYAVANKGARLFATWDLVPTETGPSLLPQRAAGQRGLAFGFRHGNDQSLAIEMVAGSRVFVCDNMMFSGDAVILHRMHTKNVSLRDEVGRGIERLLNRYETYEHNVARLENEIISDTRAKELLVDAFMTIKVLAPKYLPRVFEWYFRQAREHADALTDIAPRTAMGLLNAFTRTVKEVPSENVKYLATARIGRFFGLRSDVKDAVIGDVIDVEAVEMADAVA